MIQYLETVLYGFANVRDMPLSEPLTASIAAAEPRLQACECMTAVPALALEPVLALVWRSLGSVEGFMGEPGINQARPRGF